MADQLSPEHRDYLEAHAVDPALAEFLGVRTLASVEDLAGLGEPWEGWRNFPALAFPWTGPDGRVEHQIRPDNPTNDARGRARKYVSARGAAPVLWRVRAVPDAGRILIVEGTKQTLAAASYAPEGTEIYGISGCWLWQADGVPIPDLTVVDGRDVIVILDADAGSNPDVYEAGEGLAEACALLGATSVRFSRMGASGKAGLDDVLGALPAPARAGFLAKLVERARPKPADVRPKGRKTTPEPLPEPSDGRVVVLIDQDRQVVIRTLTGAMTGAFSGSRLFNHGGVISELTGATMTPVSQGTFNGLIQDAARTGVQTPDRFDHGWPDANSMRAVLAKAREFAPLDRVSTVPFIRQDGTVVTEPGYDRASRTVLVLGELDGIEVPEHPSPEQVAAARDLLMVDWLGDFPFPDDASRANALALVLTPFVRGLVDLVPLAVIDGAQMGVGKGLLADCLAILVTGEAARPHPYNRDDSEHRKVITSAFRAGGELVVFDEAHILEGGNFARAITASTYTDRILGVSTLAEFPNRITWVSLGNHVRVNGDMIRRVYRIGIYPDGDNPEDRPTSSFRHPGQSGLSLKDWTRAHRAELVRAALTLVRGWFAAGRPVQVKATSFGSFEGWEGIVGGIIAHAGVSGFLDNLAAWRQDADEDAGQWAVHLGWLREQFGVESFTAGQVKAKALADPAGYDSAAPPGDKLADPSVKGFSKVLGQRYSAIDRRKLGRLRLAKGGYVHGHLVSYQVCEVSPAPPDSSGSSGGIGGIGGITSTYVGAKNAHLQGGRTHTETHAFHGGNGAPPIPPIPPIPPEPDPEPEPSGPPEEWIPTTPGEGVAGRVVEVTTVEDDFNGDPIPVVRIRTKDGRTLLINGRPSVLRRELLKVSLRPGDALGVTFIGDRPLKGDPNRPARHFRVKTRAATT